MHIANTIFEYVKADVFMFCPTEYCESRANPTLESSPYLNTIGEQLAKEIHIMWTGEIKDWKKNITEGIHFAGPRVISRYLTVDHLTRVGKVMRRKPLIWDNLHANDYDMKKIFMGPMMHRSVKIKEVTSGLLSNPNVRYEANFVPFHSLSDWNAADRDMQPRKHWTWLTEQGKLDYHLDETIDQDEIGLLFNIDNNKPTVYVPEASMINAVTTWINEFTTPSGTSAPPQLTADVAGCVPDRRSNIWLLDLPETHGVIHPDPVLPAEIPTENIVQTAIAPEDPAPSELNSLLPDYSQPMETVSNTSLSQNVSCNFQDELVDIETDEPAEDELMVSVDEDITGPVVSPGPATSEEEIKNQRIALLAAFIEIYHLPFENGPRVQALFQDFHWLMRNAAVMKKTFREIE